MEVGTEQAVSFFKWERAVVLDLLRANLSESRNRGGFEESSGGVVRRRPTSGVGKVVVALRGQPHSSPLPPTSFTTMAEASSSEPGPSVVLPPPQLHTSSAHTLNKQLPAQDDEDHFSL